MRLCDRNRLQQHQNRKNNRIMSKWGLILAAMIPVSMGKILIFSNPSPAQQSNIKQQEKVTTNTIYVHPHRGKDTALGSQAAPLKTITQALRIAQPNTTIALAPGTYSEATGEVFPLIIKSNIRLQGTPTSKGYNTIIKGSGSFNSPTGAGQNVTIAVVKDTPEITGITVTNPHSRGHGLWIESANPKLTHNTFTRNGNTGVSVNGKSNPVIANNYFYLNLGNGLLVYGTSQPQVTDNEFEKTGFGVSIVQNAAPILHRNSFSGNRIGVILEGNSQAILRSNKITNSEEYGLVAISNSRADLGTKTEPGENSFNRNGKFDIQNVTSHPIPAVGTKVAGRIQGNIDFSGGISSTVISSNNITPATENPLSDGFSRLRQFPLKERSTNTLPNNNTVSSSAINSQETLPPPPEITNPVTNTPPKELVFLAPREEIPPESNTLTVSNINPNNNRQVSSLSDVVSSLNSNNFNIKYRVLVEIENNNQETQVRSLYPEAFSTRYQGKSMLQIGAFRDRVKAETTSRSIADLGLNSHVLDF